MQTQRAEDDSGVVDERGEGLVEEDLAHLQARADDASDKEEELCGKHPSGERSAEGKADGVCTEAFIEEPDIGGSEDFAEEDADSEHNQHGGEDDGERAVAALFVAGFAIAVEDGDDGDGGRAADEEVGDEVG